MENIHYRIMKKSDLNAAIRCLSESFTKSEPMTSFLKINDDDFVKFVRQLCECAVQDGLSIIAEMGENNIIGVRLSGIYAKHDNPLKIPERMQGIVALLDRVHAIPKHFLGAQKCIHLKMLAVDAPFRNQGIAQNLLFETFKNAKRRGFSYTLVEATSNTTQHIFINKFKFQILNKIHYQTFVYHQQQIFKNMPSETHCMLLGKYL